jgi:Glu-tRNA(Gln) amidotransferase subunit E-like FAD-binding protein
MRSKEEAHDYRYFPDPDLLPLEFDDAFVGARSDLPELPDDKKERFVANYGLSPYDASVLVSEKASADYFEAAERPRRQAGRQLGDQRAAGRLNKAGKDIESSPVSAAQLGGIIDLIGRGHLRQDRQGPVRDRLDRGRRSGEIVEARGMKQVTDTGAIEKAVDEIIAANPDKVEQGQGQAHAARLVRRPGDEGDRRQGQPAGRERARQGEAGHREIMRLEVEPRNEPAIDFYRRLGFTDVGQSDNSGPGQSGIPALILEKPLASY